MTERPGARIGVVGCGAISHTYLEHAPTFGLDVVAVADLDPERAREAAARHGVGRACTTDELIADPEVDVVLNLTRPGAHVEIGLAAIAAGKHVYSEKPLATTREDGRRLVDAAAAANVRLGVAPDTFFGAGIQTCRDLVDRGVIGAPVAGTAFMTGHGHESWHPDPEFYYRPGGGPLFDMGPYYLTALVVLLGPIKRVSAAASAFTKTRTIGSGPRAGAEFAVEVATHVAGTLEFASGAIVTLVMSFDVWAARLPRFEVYGSEGTISGPDPNTFGGPVGLWRQGNGTWSDVPIPSVEHRSRGVGLADMVRATSEGRPHRASGELGYHVLDAMCALLESAEQGRYVEVESSCARPAAF